MMGLHPALARELARIGRKWGELNDKWLDRPRDYSHGSPAFKRSGAPPIGAVSARPKAVVRDPGFVGAIRLRRGEGRPA